MKKLMPAMRNKMGSADEYMKATQTKATICARRASK